MTQTNQVRFLPAQEAHDEGTHIALTTGHACRVYETDPKDGKRGTVIPTMFHKPAIASGCGVVGIAEQELEQEPDANKQELIVEAISKVIEAGNESDLDGQGRPKLASVKKTAGFNILKGDLDAAWEAFVESLDDDSQGE